MSSPERVAEEMRAAVQEAHRTGFLHGFEAALEYVAKMAGHPNPPEILKEAMAYAERTYDRANREVRGQGKHH